MNFVLSDFICNLFDFIMSGLISKCWDCNICLSSKIKNLLLTTILHSFHVLYLIRPLLNQKFCVNEFDSDYSITFLTYRWNFWRYTKIWNGCSINVAFEIKTAVNVFLIVIRSFCVHGHSIFSTINIPRIYNIYL